MREFANGTIQYQRKVYPTNVLHIATECANRSHSATFPSGLPIWFIKLFTKKGDIVLDPFVGSGTTAVVCKKLGRKYIGIDIEKEFCELAQKNISKVIIEKHPINGLKKDKRGRVKKGQTA